MRYTVAAHTMHPDSILLATDGKPHSCRAEEWAFGIVRAFDIPLTVLHVRDPYLKQFYNEIYAQGRQQYIDHVDSELEKACEEIRANIDTRAQLYRIEYRFMERYGDPAEEIIAEVSEGDYDLLVVGGKRLSGLKAFRSWNLPARLSARLGSVSLLIVRETKGCHDSQPH